MTKKVGSAQTSAMVLASYFLCRSRLPQSLSTISFVWFVSISTSDANVRPKNG